MSFWAHRMYRCLPTVLRGLLLALAAGLALPGLVHADALRPLPPPPPDAEGLVRQKSHRVDEFYLRPGADLGAYHKLLLAPVDIGFAKYWARDHRDVEPEESLRMRQDLARLSRRVFTGELQGHGGYPVVEAAGPDVLEVRAAIVNLDIYAPEQKDAAIRHNYILSAGEATLVAELRDSQTGTLLARVIDRREMHRYSEFELATSVTNSAEALDLVSRWSRLLRRRLDSARADSKGL